MVQYHGDGVIAGGQALRVRYDIGDPRNVEIVQRQSILRLVRLVIGELLFVLCLAILAWVTSFLGGVLFQHFVRLLQ